MAATLIGFTGMDSWAQPPEEVLPPSFWDTVFTVRSGAGLKDNVFLSHAGRQSSGFVSAGGDVLILHAALSGTEFSFFASGDASYFPGTSPTHDEYSAFAQAKVEHPFADSIRASLAMDYFFQDQVMDITLLDPSYVPTVSTRLTAPVRGHMFTCNPGLRLALPGPFWLAAGAPATRQLYDRPLDDYWKAAGTLTLGCDYGHKSYVSLNCEPSWRWYDSDEAPTASGTPIPGTRRERFQQDALLTWRHYWDKSRTWRTTTKVGGRLTRENGGGYADYTQYSASFQIRYRAEPWELSADGRVRTYDYENQTISATNPSLRRRRDWSAGFRVERRFGEHLGLAVAYEHEAALSNDPREPYTVNTVTGSMQWEF